MRTLLVVAVLVLSAAADEPGDAAAGESRSGYDKVPEFGGPSSAGNQLREDDAAKESLTEGLERVLRPWHEWKKRFLERTGVAFGVNYTALASHATQSLGRDNASGGILELIGSWTIVNRDKRDSGTLVVKVEHRHKLWTTISPFDLGFESGSILPTAVKFNDFGWGVTNLYWQQRFLGGKATILVGRLDLTDYLDVYAMINPLTMFTNFAFSTNPTIAVPNHGLGIGGGIMVTNNVYLIAGLVDGNGQSTRAGFDTFFDDREYFTHLEVGYTSGQGRIYLDNVHVMVWHQDSLKTAGVPESWGVTFSGEWYVDDKWLPFVRAGWSDGSAPLLNATVSVGVGRRLSSHDVVGIGLNWGSPSAAGLRDQYTVEIFYRFQLTPNLAITPDLQLIIDPALNPATSAYAVFGIRARLTF